MLLWTALHGLTAFVLVASEQEWKHKQISEWTEADAQAVMTDSPWAKSLTALLDKQAPRRAGIRIPGLGRRSTAPATDASRTVPAVKPPKLALRWESALPVREAAAKAHDKAAPPLGEGYYMLAVYGIPSGTIADSSEGLASSLRRQAVLKRYAKKDVKPALVRIVFREDGPVVVYLFAKPGDITWRDHNLDFDGQVGPWKFSQSFSLDDMMFQGNLEL